MVREWGMSDRIGPMAWGSQGMVFLGEDLMHTRDYSDETARVIDEEVEKVLRGMEERCRDLLIEHRNALDLVARALLEHETIDGAEVTRLIEIGDGTGSTGTTTAVAVSDTSTRPLSKLPAPPPLPPVPLPPNPTTEPAPGVPLRFDDPLAGVVPRSMVRVVIVAVVVVVAFVVALLAQRRAPDPPARSGSDRPDQLDRTDFARPDAPWLIAVFTSATCDVCIDTWQKASVLESPDVAVQQIDFPRDRALHDRYAIEAVPLVLVVDQQGVVQNSFVGPVSATHLWAAVAEARGPRQ